METNLKITIHKAELSGRGDGWYFLVSGTKDGRALSDVGGNDWYASEKAARAAAKHFAEHCFYHDCFGWCSK